MQILDICTKKTFEMNGERRAKWFKAGFLKITDSGRKYICLFHQPMTEFYVMDKKIELEMEVVPLEDEQ